MSLDTLLSDLKPTLSKERYTFCSVSEAEVLRAPMPVFATIRETEGITIIAVKREVDSAGWSSTGSWARISLSAHSSLAAVGLTAAIAGALAEAGISSNVLAGFYHDHIFVPWRRRNAALAVLAQLSVR